MVRKAFQQAQYQLLLASPAEAELVHGYWHLHNPAPTGCVFTVLPDGCCKLVLRRQPGQPPELWLCGLWTQAFTVTLPPQSTVLGIRFKLPAAEWLVVGSLKRNGNYPLALTSVLGPDLLAAHDLPDLAQRVARWATGRLVAQPPRALFAALYHPAGPPRTVAALAAITGWSARHVNRYFQARFGLPLKTYLDLLRSYAALAHLRAGDLSAADAYCDQSHGIRAIKKYAGATPRQLHQQRHVRYPQLQPPLPTTEGW